MTSKDLKTYSNSLQEGDAITITADFLETMTAAVKDLEILEILKPLCEVMEIPTKKIRYLKVRGVVVYTFRKKAEYDLLKEWLDNDK